MPSSSDGPVYVNTSRFSFILPDDCNLRLLSYRDLLQTCAKPFFWAVHKNTMRFQVVAEYLPRASIARQTSVFLYLCPCIGLLFIPLLPLSSLQDWVLLDTVDSFSMYPGLYTKAVCLFEAKQFTSSPLINMEANRWKGRYI